MVIAIVSDVWEDAEEHATDVYWRGRIAFLSETSALIQATQKWRLLSFINSCFKPLFKRIDNMKCISLGGTNFNWSKDNYPRCLATKRIALEEPKFDWVKDHPYCDVTNKDIYDDPDHYLAPADARDIKNVKTLQSDLYWLNNFIEVERKSSNVSTVKIQCLVACLWCKWFWLTGWYAVCIVIGFPCFGIWWPLPFRKYSLSIGYLLEDAENEDETNEDNGSKLLGEEIQKLAYRIEALEGTNESIDDEKTQSEKEILRTSSSMLSRASLRHLEKKKVYSRMNMFSGAKDYN